jgi:hypothetical protein
MSTHIGVFAHIYSTEEYFFFSSRNWWEEGKDLQISTFFFPLVLNSTFFFSSRNKREEGKDLQNSTFFFLSTEQYFFFSSRNWWEEGKDFCIPLLVQLLGFAVLYEIGRRADKSPASV